MLIDVAKNGIPSDVTNTTTETIGLVEYYLSQSNVQKFKKIKKSDFEKDQLLPCDVSTPTH